VTNTTVKRIEGDELYALQSRLHAALAHFQQFHGTDYPLAVLTSELLAYHEAVKAGAIARSPTSDASLKRRLTAALLDAFNDVLRGDPPDACLDIARKLRDLNTPKEN
jgi:hypothetical protein